jgi:hypothetical protein
VAANEGIYLYCFARSDSVSGLELIGVDGRQGVEAIEAGGIAAVCSRVSLDEFRDDPAQNQVPDPQWLIPRACRHESVIEAVMTRSPVLPVRFGALFSSPFALQAILERALPQIGRFLAYAADKQEWTVKGFVDSKMAETWLLESDPALVARRQSLPESPGMRYFQQKQLAAAAQQQVKQWARTVAAEVGDALKDVADEFRVLNRQRSQLAGKTEEVALNLAFLLATTRIEEFREQVDSIGASYGAQGLSLQCTGPWPPFSFCPTLEETLA